jgi:hypothetical protein
LQDFGGLFDAEAAEIAQFDDPAFAFVRLRQAFQRVIQCNQIGAAFVGFRERNA